MRYAFCAFVLMFSSQLCAQVLLPQQTPRPAPLAPALRPPPEAPRQSPPPEPEVATTLVKPLYSTDCSNWQKEDEKTGEFPYLKNHEGITYVNQKLDVVIFWMENQLFYARKKGNVGALLTPDGYNIKASDELIGRQNIGNILIAMNEVMSVMWGFDNRGKEMRSHRLASNRNTYPGLVCNQKEGCYLVDKQKRRLDIKDGDILNTAKADYPIHELEESLKNSCIFMQERDVADELKKFIKNCKIKITDKTNPLNNLKKLCSEAAKTVKPLLQPNLK